MRSSFTKIAAALLFAIALFSCDIGMSSSDKGSITMRLPDQSQLSGSASADSLDGVSRSVSSGGSISAGTVDQFKVVVRNLSSQQTITQIVAPGSSVTIDELEPGSWDVAIFGYETATGISELKYYGNARGIAVEGGETSNATVGLRHIVGTSGLGLNLAVPQSGGAPSTFNRDNIVKAYVSYTGNELSQSGAVFYDVAVRNSDGSLVSGQTDGQNYQLNIPLPDFLEPGYSYSAKVYLFVHDPLSGEGDCALWGGSVSGTAQNDAKLEGDLAFLDHHLAKKEGPSTNVDIKMDKALAQQLETITGVVGTTGYKFMESAIYDAATSDEKSYSNMSIYPAISNLCGSVPVIVECDGMAWTDNFTFKHPSQIPSIAVPGVNSDSKLYIPAFVSRTLGTPSLYPSAPTQWKKCQAASSYDEYGFKKYSASGFDADSWGAPFQYEAVGANDDITYTAPNIFLPINDSGYDTFKCKTTIAAGTYGYFEDDDSATTKNISVEFDVYGAAWTVTGPASVLPNTDFTLALSNSAATSSELQTVVDAEDASTGGKLLSASVGGSRISGASTAVSGNKILATIPGQAWLSNTQKTITLSYGANTLGSVTVTVAQPSGGVSGNIDLYVSSTSASIPGDDTNGDGSSANPYATLQKAFDYIIDTPNPNADYIIHITGTIMGTSYIADEAGKNVKAKSVTLLGTSALVNGEPQDVLDGKDIASPVLAVVSQGLTVTVRNLKITNEMRGGRGSCGLMVGDETIASSVVLDGGVYIVNCLGMGDGAAITICKNSSVTMKDGCLVDNTTTGIGSCGGVYINQGSFLMQGGTISNISAKDGKTAVCAYGRFEMSGNAIVSSSSDNYVVVPIAPSETTPGTYTVPYPVVIAGDLTQSSAATISPGGGGTFDLATYQNGLQIVAEASAGLLANNYTKFAVVPQSVIGGASIPWSINQNGQLDDGSSGGGGTSGNVVLYVKAGGSSSAEGTESDPFGSISAAVATFSGSSGDANTDYVIKVIGDINDSVPSETCNIKSLTIEGATGSGADSITGMSHIYYDSSPLIFKNIKITGSTSGIEIGTCWDPPSNYYHVNVTFDEGTLITGNTTSNANYGGAMYIYKDSTVTIKEGCEISGNYNTDSTNAGIVVSNGGSLVMEGGTLENNCRPPYGIGYAVYAMSGSTFEMKGGTIKNNGIGVKIANGSTFKMSGSACVAYNNNVGSDYSEDMIELESGAKIILDGDLQTTGTVPAGVIRPETYGETVHVLDQTTSGLIANNCGKFNVDPDTSSGFPGVKYKVGENGYLQEYAISLYVKEGGTGDGSSATSALASIEAAATYISQYGDSSKEFKIKIVETLTGAQILQGVDNTNAASITIEGANGLSNGVPQDCLDGQGSAQKTLTIKTDSDQLPVYIKNLKITGATQNGLYIGGAGFGGVSNVSTAVIIDEGALITGNGSSDPENTTDGGGVYVFRSSELYVYSGEISNNTATRYGGGIYSYGSVTLYGGTIKNNTATQGKGIYLESGYGTLEMGYHASVDSSNDIYLPAGRVITISSSLTASINPVALIRVPDSEYQEDTNLQILDESTSGLINSYYQYFRVICPEGPSYSGSGYGYTINSSGELNYYNYN